MWATDPASGEGLVQQTVQIVASHDLTLVVVVSPHLRQVSYGILAIFDSGNAQAGSLFGTNLTQIEPKAFAWTYALAADDSYVCFDASPADLKVDGLPLMSCTFTVGKRVGREELYVCRRKINASVSNAGSNELDFTMCHNRSPICPLAVAFDFHHPGDRRFTREIRSLFNWSFLQHFDITASFSEHQLDRLKTILFVAAIPTNVDAILNEDLVVI